MSQELVLGKELVTLERVPICAQGFLQFFVVTIIISVISCKCLCESDKSLRQYHRGMNCPVCSMGHFKFSAEQ